MICSRHGLAYYDMVKLFTKDFVEIIGIEIGVVSPLNSLGFKKLANT